MFMLRSLGLNLVNRRGASLLAGCKQINNPGSVLRSVGSGPKFYSTSEGPLGAIWPKFGPTFDLAHWSSINESVVRPFLQEANSNPDKRPSQMDVWRMEGIIRTTFRALVSAQKLTVVGSDEEDLIHPIQLNNIGSTVFVYSSEEEYNKAREGIEKDPEELDQGLRAELKDSFSKSINMAGWELAEALCREFETEQQGPLMESNTKLSAKTEGIVINGFLPSQSQLRLQPSFQSLVSSFWAEVLFCLLNHSAETNSNISTELQQYFMSQLQNSPGICTVMIDQKQAKEKKTTEESTNNNQQISADDLQRIELRMPDGKLCMPIFTHASIAQDYCTGILQQPAALVTQPESWKFIRIVLENPNLAPLDGCVVNPQLASIASPQSPGGELVVAKSSNLWDYVAPKKEQSK